jgi:cytochrome c biogenesis protein CcdA
MLFLLAFLGGVLAIASPCILPVIPLVFARSGRSFVRETAPMLVGLAAAFTAAALLATTAIRSLLLAAEVGRVVALVALGGVGIALLSDRFAERVTRPLTRLGASFAGGPSSSILSSFGVGAAIGLLWAPCAGPLLGLVIAAAAASSRAVAAALFFTFAVGASVMIAVVLALGNRGLARLRRTGMAERVVRRTLGVATVASLAKSARDRKRELVTAGR